MANSHRERDMLAATSRGVCAPRVGRGRVRANAAVDRSGGGAGLEQGLAVGGLRGDHRSLHRPYHVRIGLLPVLEKTARAKSEHQSLPSWGGTRVPSGDIYPSTPPLAFPCPPRESHRSSFAIALRPRIPTIGRLIIQLPVIARIRPCPHERGAGRCVGRGPDEPQRRQRRHSIADMLCGQSHTEVTRKTSHERESRSRERCGRNVRAPGWFCCP